MPSEEPTTDVVIDFFNKLNKTHTFASRINTEDLNPEAQFAASRLSPETTKRYYGSGMFCPEVIKGKRILDLGSGGGINVFLYSKLVGENGHIVGVDLSEGLLENAKEQTDYYLNEWGYEKPNFEFIMENIEKISEVLPKESFDIVVSNGVLGLCENKGKVIEQAFEMLKPNGMFLLSDVFGEESANGNRKMSLCFSIPVAWKELSPLVTSKGFTTPHLTTCGSIDIKPEAKAKVENNFMCAEARMFKLAPGTEHKENSSVTYKGTIPNYEKSLPFDITTVFKTGESVNIDGELATNLANSDFSEHFTFGEATGEPQNKRNQNPFDVLRERENDKNAPPPRFVM